MFALSALHKIVLVSICWVCVSHTWRLQTSNEQKYSTSFREDLLSQAQVQPLKKHVSCRGALNISKVFTALLVALNPAAEFNPSSPGRHVATREPAVARHRQVLKSRAAETVMLQAASADEAKSLLLLLAARRTPEEAKSTALQKFMNSSVEEREGLLDAALSVIDASEGSLFAGRQWPLPLPSRRAKLGSYRRLLESLMDEEPGGSARFTEGGDAGKRRRFLALLFRQLRSNKGGVWDLEREANKLRRAATSMQEMLQRTPANLETPKYDVIATRPTWEVRQYAEFAVASTRRDRPVAQDGMKLQQPSTPMAGGFQALAGYIFGRNVDSNGVAEKMAMTTPVLNSAATGEMSFVMPSRYWVSEVDGGVAPPKPIDNTVQVVRKGGGALERSEMLATLWFGGFAGSAEVDRRKAELLQAVGVDDEWEAACREDESAEQLLVLMQYNDPFTPPWKRRNEVALPVRRRQ